MVEFLNFLSSLVTILFGGYIVLIFLNRIDFNFTISMQNNASNPKKIKKNPNELQEDNALQLKKNMM